jgi:hypothetical protein
MVVVPTVAAVVLPIDIWKVTALSVHAFALLVVVEYHHEPALPVIVVEPRLKMLICGATHGVASRVS